MKHKIEESKCPRKSLLSYHNYLMDKEFLRLAKATAVMITMLKENNFQASQIRLNGFKRIKSIKRKCRRS